MFDKVNKTLGTTYRVFDDKVITCSPDILQVSSSPSTGTVSRRQINF